MEVRLTVEDLLRRWQSLQEQGKTATVEDLCADCPENTAELRERLQAVASIMSLLGLEAESGSIASVSTENHVPTGSSPTVEGDRSELDADTAGPARPVQIPGYEVLGELGRGGMGVVYLARQISLNRVVALKEILIGDRSSPSQIARFRNEGLTVARLRHPNIVQVYEVGEHDGLPFITFEYIRGSSLDRKLTGEPIPSSPAAALMAVLARGVSVAHELGIVHRDLKPGNVLLDDQLPGVPGLGVPKVTDFGLAKLVSDQSGLTRTDTVLGSPSYMAPEQAEGKTREVGPAADIHALGAIFYELLTGRPPFRGATALDTIQQVKTAEPLPPSRLVPGLARDAETIVLKCLQKEPSKRYGTAGALADDLDRFLRGEPIAARPIGNWERAGRWCLRNKVVAASLATVALSLLAATVVSVLFGLRAEQSRQAEAEGRRGETKAKQEAVQARRDVQQQLIDLSTESGLAAARDGDHALALLWFARTAQLSGDYPEREELSRIRYGNWRRHVWTPEGRAEIPGFRQGQDRFRQLAFSPDGDYLVAIASVGDCTLWDQPRGRLVPLTGPATAAAAAAWEPKSGLLAVGGRDGTIRVLAPPSFTPVEELPSEGDVAVVTFSRDGRRLAWGGTKGARIWDRETKRYSTPLLKHGGPVVTLAFSADGTMLATSARDMKARVFRVASDQPDPVFPPVPHALAEYGINHGGPERVAPRFAAGDRVLLTAEKSGAVYNLRWRSAAGGEVLTSTETQFANEYLGAFDVTRDGSRVAVAWAGGLIRLCDAATRSIVAAIPGGPMDWCEDLVFSADGQVAVTCSQDTKVQLWSVNVQRNLELTRAAPPLSHPQQAVRVDLSKDGRHLAVALWDGTVCLWRGPDGPPKAYEIEAGGATWVALSPNRRLMVPKGASFRGGSLRQTRVYDATNGEPAGPLLSPGGIIVDAAFSPDGEHLAMAALTAQTPDERNPRMFLEDGKAGYVQLWDWKDGRKLVGPVPMPTEPRGLAFRPDGRTLAVVCADYRVLLVDPRSGAVLRNLDPGIRTKPFNANLWTSNGDARFSPDGRFLLTWERVPTLHVWDPDSGRLLHTLKHTERVENAAFNPRAPHILATGGRDSTIRVWDLDQGKLLVQLQQPRWTQMLQFSPDGSELISGCLDGIIRSWNWRTGTLSRGLAHDPAQLCFDFSADRHTLVVQGPYSLEVTHWPSGTPLGPESTIRDTIHWGVVVPSEDRRAIVAGFAGMVTGFDLEKMVTPTTAPADELTRLAELAAGRRIMSEGRVVPLSTTEWADRWEQLRHTEVDPADAGHHTGNGSSRSVMAGKSKNRPPAVSS